MQKVNPINYEYLWTDYEVNFIFTSSYLFKEFKNADFILIYDWQSKGLHFFLNKKQRERFADEGVLLYTNRFQQWKTEINKNIVKAVQCVKETKKRKNRNDVEWLSYSEIGLLLDGQGMPISKRDKQDWILAKVRDWKLITGKDAEKIKKSFVDYFFKKKSRELTGLCAYNGIYKGKARILKTVFSDAVQKEILKVKKGDVLIANTTGPEVISACMNAGAIVTDEGGLTSHAAIVSRELRIPCVVGTKIATKMFKDGDIIEVNAEKGIVKKIK